MVDRYEIAQFTQSGIDRVIEMRKAGGLSLFSGLNVDLKLHKRLINDEQKEIADAKTLAGRADNHIDVFVFQIGMVVDMAPSENFAETDPALWQKAYEFSEECINKCQTEGINHREAFRLVHESNLSKLVTDDEIESTSLKYGKCNVIFKEVSNGLLSCFSARTFHHNDELIPKGKWLKSTGFFAPKWEEDKSWIM